MSEKIFHWTNTFKTLGEDDDGGLDIKGSASTDALDRAGDIIESNAWTKSGGLENFKNNPIVLFNHDYDRPIGRAKEIGVTENGLELTARISKSAGEIKDLIKGVTPSRDENDGDKGGSESIPAQSVPKTSPKITPQPQQ